MENVQTETPKLAKLAKCAHDGCTCTVPEGEEFCSDYCAAQAEGDHAAMADDECHCGHSECTTVTVQSITPIVVGTA